MGTEVWWYIIRVSGLAAWAFGAGSVLAGLGMSTGLVPVRRARELHAWLGGLTVVAIALHLASLVADSYLDVGLSDIAVPFASSLQRWPGCGPMGRCSRD